MLPVENFEPVTMRNRDDGRHGRGIECTVLLNDSILVEKLGVQNVRREIDKMPPLVTVDPAFDAAAHRWPTTSPQVLKDVGWCYYSMPLGRLELPRRFRPPVLSRC